MSRPRVADPILPANSLLDFAMELCRQLHVLKMSDSYVGIYSPFEHGLAFLPDHLWELVRASRYSKIPPVALSYLREQNILVESGFEEQWLTSHAPSDDVRLNSMYLITTFACNLRCKYCVVLGANASNSRADRRMPVNIGRHAVRYFHQYLDEHKPTEARITFYGGEPLLNKPLLKALIPEIASVRYDSECPKQIHTVIITNGYHFDPGLLPLFSQNDVGVCVSIDGLQHNHDAARIGPQSHLYTHAKVVKSFLRYRDAGLSVGISTTIGKHNVSELPRIGEYFLNELGARFIEFQIPYFPSHGSNASWVSSADAASQILETYSRLESAGATEAFVYRRLSDFRAGRIRFRDCGASAAQLVVLPDGKIGPCHSLANTSHYFAGDIRDAVQIDDMPAFREWARRHPFNMSECHTCPYISLCGGGCVYNALMAHGTIWAKDPQVCPFMKEFVDWLLLQTWGDQAVEKVALDTNFGQHIGQQSAAGDADKPRA